MSFTQDKERSYQGINMQKAVLAVHYLNEKCKKSKTPSGYEKLIELLPPDLIPLSEAIVGKMSSHNASIANDIAELKKNPENYIDQIEISTAFRRNELHFFQIGKSSEYSQDMFEEDVSLCRSGLTSHYLERKVLIDKCVREALANGATQIVIPACGLDTIAERYAKRYPKVHFFLSDLPEIIEERKGLIDQGFRNVHIGGADLEKSGGLTDLLKSSENFDLSAKTLYIFEGISMYLSPNSVRQMFCDIRQSTPRHEIVMGFVLHATEGEKRLVNWTYEGKSVLPLWKIHRTFTCGSPESGDPGYLMKGTSPADQSRESINWSIVNNAFMRRHPELSVSQKDLCCARDAYQCSHGIFLTFTPK